MDWPALLWTLAALISGTFNAALWWDAIADYRWAEATSVTLERLLTARDQLTTHSILFAIQIDMLLVGAVVLLVPESPARRLVTIGGLMLIPVMLAIMAMMSRRHWTRIVRMIETKNQREDML